MVVRFPAVALVLLVGPSGSGKSTFAAQHFLPTEVLSSDRCRAMVSDDETRQDINDDAFALLHFWLDLRLKNRRFTVVDSTALKPSARDRVLAIAARHRTPVFAIALDVPLEECVRRDSGRERQVGRKVIERQYATFEQVKKELEKEARLKRLHVLSPEDMVDLRIERGGTARNGSEFDVIGDIHGCYLELADLFEQLGYVWDGQGVPTHPRGRTPVFVGDLTDRGPDSPMVLRLVVEMVASDRALFVPGNHDDKLFRMLKGNKVTRNNGLELTEQQIQSLPEETRLALAADVITYLAGAPPYLVLDDGKLIVAHAGIREELIGRYDGQVRQFTLYGDVRGFEANGRPIRYDWAQEYTGSAIIAYGHTPQEDVRFVGNTINLDGGCVFGGSLNAVRYPEREIVSIPSRAIYAYHENLSYSHPVSDGIE